MIKLLRSTFVEMNRINRTMVIEKQLSIPHILRRRRLQANGHGHGLAFIAQAREYDIYYKDIIINLEQ